ncbi:hypothetical protein JWG40_04140 [Leptospira sp. 201903074]|uniref:hypothetical protein n=1 Tax=Leptospira abararensis TaxID=2810036 RepID=UPI001962B7E9|nr:hypothetical protein [Leptospira abararensis]MBM9546191.1 hypothetical protein [Leptospira abararensis]
MKCEFEEKVFEHEINSILAGKFNSFAPGQVLENILGFDVALKINKPYKFSELERSIFIIKQPFYANFLQQYHAPVGEDLNLIRNKIGQLKTNITFPKIKFNLFLQYKRPYSVIGSKDELWDHWNTPYYKYSITTHQQRALEGLAKNLADKAIVAYASPIFHTYNELWDCKENNDLLTKTNFVKAEHLNNHHIYTYNNNEFGQAFSEKEKIDSFSLEEEIKSLIEKNGLLEYEDNIKIISEICQKIMNDDTYYKNILNRFKESFKSQLPDPIAFISLFTHLTATNWLVFQVQ